jgi:glycosyltransferase involved in cell wall biosynthesis
VEEIATPLARPCGEPEVSIVMPCLNESTIEACIRKARQFLRQNEIDGEIVIGDIGSTDNSVRLAIDAGARVVSISTRGYGAAILGAVRSARARYIIVGDADGSYDFSALARSSRNFVKDTVW